MFSLGLAELPRAEELVGERLDLLALEGGDRRHHQLDARLLLEIGELAFEVRGRDGRENMRLIDDPSGELGQVRRGEPRADHEHGEES